jgi:hypothetical protein
MKIRSMFTVGVAMAVFGAAGVPAGEKTVTTKAEAAKPDAKPAESATATEAKAKPELAKCEYLTGSRIRHDPPVECESGPPGSRSFTSAELQSTGELNMSEALRKLDPRFY